MNITEETKRHPAYVCLDFFINEDHEWYLIRYDEYGNKDYFQIDKMTNTEIGDLVINEIKECI